MKTCNRCGKEKELSEFNKDRAASDGLQHSCKVCNKERSSKWRQDNPDMAAATDRKWQQDNKDKKSAINHKYELSNPEKRRAKDAIAYAIKSGKLKRLPCVICGNPKSHGHHGDYSKVLSVDWLCHKHHMRKHKLLRDKAESLAK